MSEVTAARDTFGRRLRQSLEKGLEQRGIQATVETEAVRFTQLHRALVTSPQFEDMGHGERQDILWRILRDELSPEEQLRVSVVVALTPDEVGE